MSNVVSVVRSFLILVLLIALAAAIISTGGTIQSGNVGLRTTVGKLSMQEITPGFFIKAPVIQTVREFSAKEIEVALDDMRPKAKDNLSLADLDVVVYYRVQADKVAEVEVKYAGQSLWDPEIAAYLPAFRLVTSVARNAVYEEVAKHDSLAMHTRRSDIEDQVLASVQRELDRTDPGVFLISRVVVRALLTDQSIEEAIRDAVAQEKRLAAMEVKEQTAKREAQIEIERAKGLAEANRIINSSLTREYLQHEANQALMRFAEKGAATVVVPANMVTAPLIQIPAPTVGGQ